jgi:type 1 glutamine amidotransferase
MMIFAGLRTLGRALFVLVLLATTPALADDGFKPIFNGKNLDGWDGNPKFWSVEDGTITGRTTKENPTKGNTFLIWRQAPVDDFVLKLKYKIVGGNSGIQYRSQDLGDWVVGGYQGDFEAGDMFSGINYEERGRGILALRGQKVTIGADGKKAEEQVGDTKELQKHIKKEDWNDYEIIAQGNHLIHKINGQVTSEVIDNQKEKAAQTGVLALQLHAGPPMVVQFKDIELKRTKLADGRKKIVLVAGTPSHGPGDHEFNAGVKLLDKCLADVPGVVAAAYYNGWPADPTAFDNADTILLYMDGGGGHPVIQRNRLTEIDQLMKSGVGLACAHYAVEVPKEKGGPDLTNWIGGYYETGYSINPHWDATFAKLPEHPTTRGVKPFKINDEWYYNIRFPENANNVQPLLSATPPDQSRGTPAAKEHPGREEVVAWAVERPDGGRGFGFTGGHNHENWGNDDFRKFVLNALLWTAKAEVPNGGVESKVTAEELQQNLDPKRK